MEAYVMRLDRFLAECGAGSRKEVSAMVRKGRVCVKGLTVKDPSVHIDENTPLVSLDGKELFLKGFSYYMLNKPAGVVSATKDGRDSTVLDLIKEKQKKKLFPVGRLDKDTEGLLIITDDGPLGHRLLAPGRHVDKQYYVKLNKPVSEEDVRAFAEGLIVDKEFTAMPAVLLPKEDNDALVTIHEGKFHQVKRMFEAVGKTVVYLKRLSMGGLKLDESLAPGQYRELTEEEVRLLQSSAEGQHKLVMRRKRAQE